MSECSTIGSANRGSEHSSVVCSNVNAFASVKARYYTTHFALGKSSRALLAALPCGDSAPKPAAAAAAAVQSVSVDADRPTGLNAPPAKKKRRRDYMPAKMPLWLGDDQYVSIHTNGVCVVGLAPTHPLVDRTRGLIISSIDQRAVKAISGKKKRGALFCQPDTVLFTATCTDGSVFKVRAGIGGKLVEVNERIVADPTLLQRRPDTDGHLAIVLPRMADVGDARRSFLSADQYAAVVASVATVRGARDAAPVTAEVAVGGGGGGGGAPKVGLKESSSSSSSVAAMAAADAERAVSDVSAVNQNLI